MNDTLPTKIRKMLLVLLASLIFGSLLLVLNTFVPNDYLNILFRPILFLPICLIVFIVTFNWIKDTILGKTVYAFTAVALSIPVITLGTLYTIAFFLNGLFR